MFKIKNVKPKVEEVKKEPVFIEQEINVGEMDITVFLKSGKQFSLSLYGREDYNANEKRADFLSGLENAKSFIGFTTKDPNLSHIVHSQDIEIINCIYRPHLIKVRKEVKDETVSS